MENVNKRVYYIYFDVKLQKQLENYIDLDLHVDDDYIHNNTLQKFVKRKWKNNGYKQGDINSVEFMHMDS